jgi:hypothetical protein
MTVFSIWESRFPPEHVERGREVTDAIWQEMPDYSGYLRHVLIEDLDDPGHLFVVSEWESREAAGQRAGRLCRQPDCAPGERARRGAAPPHGRASPPGR